MNFYQTREEREIRSKKSLRAFGPFSVSLQRYSTVTFNDFLKVMIFYIQFSLLSCLSRPQQDASIRVRADFPTGEVSTRTFVSISALILRSFCDACKSMTVFTFTALYINFCGGVLVALQHLTCRDVAPSFTTEGHGVVACPQIRLSTRIVLG